MPVTSAIPAADLSFDAAVLRGDHEFTGPLSAFQIREGLDGQGRLTAHGEEVTVRSTNATGTGTPSPAGLSPDRETGQATFRNGSIIADLPRSKYEILVVPIAGQTAMLQGQENEGAIRAHEANRVTETPRVDSTRPLLSAPVGETLQISTSSASLVRVEGSFEFSIWSWNFTAADSTRSRHFMTGVDRRDVISAPLGPDLSWTQIEKVAQVEVRNGWIEVGGTYGSTTTLHLASLTVTGAGEAALAGVTGELRTSPAMNLEGAKLHANGQYRMHFTHAQQPQVRIDDFVGALAANDVPVRLGEGALRDSSTVASSQGRPTWFWVGGIAALMIAAVIIKGPAQVSRFNRIQSRFESKDYIGVLARIEPFTRRRRYERRATFLKAISLLSLQEYREAGLYLRTLGPRESPEPATKAFLQACAAAGQGHDSQAIKLLSECFRDDPTYIEEAKTVPVLAGYLPYFTLSSAEDAAT